jgi:hypothetical protein
MFKREDRWVPSRTSVQRSAEIAVLVSNLKSTKNHAIGLCPKAQIGAPLFGCRTSGAAL